MFKSLLSFMLLIGCISRPTPIPEPKQDVCAMLYDPHLCIIVIDSEAFSGHGSNKCLALKKLKQVLVERDHNPLLIQKAKCGRVFN
jgi:hypothetical protein